MLYDITQELFGGAVYPGDMAPSFRRVRALDAGSTSNVTELSMNVHNATHIDAPFHKIKGGKTIDELDLTACIGECEVIPIQDKMRLKKSNAKRILLAGYESIDEEMAHMLVQKQIVLVGVESQSVGSREVHRILLEAEIVVLEGIRLVGVPEGCYRLSALPIKLGGCDGAPCRAVLTDL